MASRVEQGARISGMFWSKVSATIVVMLVITMLAGHSAQAQTYSVLHRFTGADGSGPAGNLIMDGAGNLYGTTYSGGSATAGVVFSVDPTNKETVLHNFIGAPRDGAHPFANLIRDAAGNLYGTTFYGGSSAKGTVFKVNTANKLTVLHSFAGADGANPNAALVQDGSGNLYGTTTHGGNLACGSGAGCGTVFKLDTTGTLTVLHSFVGSDGSVPNAGLILDSAGNLYGTTYRGGPNAHGTVFKLDSAANLTILFPFRRAISAGQYPFAGLVRDSLGNLYGTTSRGGASDNGVVFKVSTTGQETILHTFAGGADGAHPFGGLARDTAGNLYGITTGGGTTGCGGYGCGTVFKLDTSSNKTLLYTFMGGADGGNPYPGVILDSAGNLYGTAPAGGTGNHGVVYKIAP